MDKLTTIILTILSIFILGFISHGQSITVTWQPDSTDGIDSHISGTGGETTTNYGTFAELFVGSWQDGTQRSLFKIPALGDSIPADAVIISSKIIFVTDTEQGSVTDTVVSYILKRDWVELEVTQEIYSTGNSWSTAGAFDGNDIYLTPADTTIGIDWTGTDTLDITTTTSLLVGVDSVYKNYGILIKAISESGNNYGRWESSHTLSGASNRPIILITYMIPIRLTGIIPKVLIGTMQSKNPNGTIKPKVDNR